MTYLFTRIICGDSPKVNQRRSTKVGRRQLVHPSTPLITSVERNCLHGSLWLIQPHWSTWGTRVNGPLDWTILLITISVHIYLTTYVSCLDNELNMSDTCIQYEILLGLINFWVSRINEVEITGPIDIFLSRMLYKVVSSTAVQLVTNT